jgi:four helix bundle protein
VTGVAQAETRVTSLVPGAAPTDTIASGLDFTCAITTDGHVACWGKNDNGQLGHDTSEPFNPTPTLVTGIDEVVSIAAGASHVCALRQSGQVWCWGLNSYGQLRDEALRAAKRTCLDIAEGAGCVTRADKGRAYAIARGECVECVAAVEIAGETGDAVASAGALVTRLGNEVYLMLGGLVG